MRDVGVALVDGHGLDVRRRVQHAGVGPHGRRRVGLEVVGRRDEGRALSPSLLQPHASPHAVLARFVVARRDLGVRRRARRIQPTLLAKIR